MESIFVHRTVWFVPDDPCNAIERTGRVISIVSQIVVYTIAEHEFRSYFMWFLHVFAFLEQFHGRLMSF